jgi:hypothetical protein
MDGSRFDRLTRAASSGASGTSRRGAIAGLAVGLAAVFAAAGGEEARGKKRKRCRCHRHCQGKICGDDGCGKTCGTCSGSQQFCCNGQCRTECCGDGQCAAGETCLRGACVIPCAIDQNCPAAAATCCNGGCVDTNTDRGNCGACGRNCNPPGSCEGGQCAVG